MSDKDVMLGRLGLLNTNEHFEDAESEEENVRLQNEINRLRRTVEAKERVIQEKTEVINRIRQEHRIQNVDDTFYRAIKLVMFECEESGEWDEIVDLVYDCIQDYERIQSRAKEQSEDTDDPERTLGVLKSWVDSMREETHSGNFRQQYMGHWEDDEEESEWVSVEEEVARRIRDTNRWDTGNSGGGWTAS